MVPTCSLAITRETLSAWRSQSLTRQEQQRLAAHIPHCAVCQRKIDTFERIALTLRREPPASFSGQDLWNVLFMRISQPERSHMTNARNAAVMGGLATVATLVIIFAVVFNLSSERKTTPPLTSTATTSATTPLLSPTPDFQGWVLGVAVQYGNVAFAPGNPAIGYVCGGDAGGGTAISFGVTHNGGTSWQIQKSPSLYAACSLSISSANPNYVALLTTSCYSCASETPSTRLDISRDGGKTWKQGVLPNTDSVDPHQIDFAVWAGSDLFARPQLAQKDSQPPHTLAVSINGNPFTWVDNVSPGSMMSAGSALYLVTGMTGCDPNHNPNCYVLKKTVDGGVTWTAISDSNTGALIDAGTDGTLIGEASSIVNDQLQETFFRSTDEGITWNPLPSTPSNGNGTVQPLLASDAALYVQTNADSGKIWRLAPGASQWTAVAMAPTDEKTGGISLVLAVIAVDHNTHSATLWGIDNGGSPGIYRNVIQVP